MNQTLGGLHLIELADKSHDLSQAKKKITFVKPEQIHKMTIIFTQNGQKNILIENHSNSLSFLSFGNSYFLLRLR